MAFFSENKNNIGWNEACGRMTLFARLFFSKKKQYWMGRVCGRMTRVARWVFCREKKNNIGSVAVCRKMFFSLDGHVFTKRLIILDGTEYVGE